MSTHSLGRLLIVDDEIELTAALCDSLTAQGYETVTFASGYEALEALRSQSFDLLLTDLMMPEMDGITLLQAALEIDPHIVGIIMTGQGTVSTAVEAMKTGAFDYMLKPFKLQMLLPILSRALAVRRLRMENVHLRQTMAMYELGQTIAHTLDIDTLVNKTADAAFQQLEADEVSLMLPTPDGEELYIAAVRGQRTERKPGNRIPLSEGIAGWVAGHQVPVTLKDEIHDRGFEPVYSRSETRSGISMPMLAGGKLVGVLNASAATQRRSFTLGQVKGLSILVSIAATALESAGLYSEVLRAEEKYRSIFENAVDGIFQSTPEGRLLTANPSLARMLGYDSPKELLKCVTDTQEQICADPERRTRFVHLMYERGVVSGFESQVIRRDGSTVWVSINARCVNDSSGNLLYFEGSVADINDRKQAEETLRRLKHQNELILNCAGEGIYGLDTDGRFTFINPAAAQMLGYRGEELVGKRSHEIVHHTRSDGSRHQEAECPIYAVLTNGLPHREENDFFWRKDESRFPVEFTSTPIMEEGKITGAVVTLKDISERKKAEEDLRSSEERMRLIIESSPIGLRIAQQGKHVYANPAFGRMFGYKDPNEMTGLPVEAFYVSEERERIRQGFADLQAGRLQSLAFEAVGLTKGGRRFDVAVWVTQIDYSGEPASLAFVIDVSSEKALRAQLFQAQKMEAIGTLAGGIAHDFNNILGIIMGNAELTLFEIQEGSQAYANLQQVIKASNRARDLVQQIFTFSRHGEEELRPLHVSPIIKEALKLLRSSLPSTIEIQHEINVPFSEDCVLADPTQIHQILMNLCANAAHAMHENGGVLEVKYSLIDFDVEDYARPPDLNPGTYVGLTIRDTGHGMSRQVMERIFEPYFTTKKQGEGTGLGLAVVHGIVKKHAGTITVTSEIGEGSTFQVYLPRQAANALSLEKEIPVALCRGSERILLVDDEKSLLDATCKLLEHLGYMVVAKACSVEALEEFRARPNDFDLVITDQTMPKMTGLKLAAELLSIRPDLPIILCTGFSDAVTPEKVETAGIRALIMKPVVMSNISDVIRKVLSEQ